MAEGESMEGERIRRRRRTKFDREPVMFIGTIAAVIAITVTVIWFVM